MKYYYLISSLPDLQMDSSLSQEQLDDLIGLISQNLSEEDLQILRSLLHASDNQNLLYILFREYHDFEIQSFIYPGYLSIEVLENYRREYPSLPDYMANYLNDLSGSFSSLSLGEMEHSLNLYFYDYLARLDSVFLHTYYLWRFRLKRSIAALNHKAYPYLNTANTIEEPFLPLARVLHGLKDFEEIANQLLPFIESNNLEAIEQQVNKSYWEFADCWQEPFSADAVFAYMIKLIHLYRWKGFTSKGELARSKFEKLIADLKEREASPKMPVI